MYGVCNVGRLLIITVTRILEEIDTGDRLDAGTQCDRS